VDLAYFACRFDAIHPRHHDISEKQIEWFYFRLFDRSDAAIPRDRVKTIHFEDLHERVSDDLLVINHEYP
jgi:hypothetical protein